MKRKHDDKPRSYERDPPIEYSKWRGQMMDRDATSEDILALFDRRGDRFDCSLLAIAVCRTCKLGNRVTTIVDTRFVELLDVCRRRVRGFDSYDLEYIASGCAKIEIHDASPLFTAIADAALRLIKTFKIRSLALLVVDFVTVRVKAARFFAAVAEEALAHLSELNAQLLARLAHAFSSPGIDASQLMKEIAGEACSRLDTFDDASLATLAQAYKTAGITAPLDAICEAARWRLREFSMRDLGRMLEASVATAGKDRLRDEITEEATTRLTTRSKTAASTEELAKGVKAFADQSTQAFRFLNAIAHQIESTLPDFEWRELVYVAFAYTSAGIEVRGVFEALKDAILTRKSLQRSDYPTFILANVAWAFAKARFDAPTVFDAVAGVAKPRLHAFHAQELSKIAWAFAMARVEARPVRPFLEALADAAVAQLWSFTPRDLATTAWALALARIDAPRFFEAAAVAAVPRLGSFTPQDLANTAAAFAQRGVEARSFLEVSFLEAIAGVVLSQVTSFDTTSLADVARAFATAGVVNSPVYAALVDSALSRLHEFDNRDLANMAWAAATARVAAPELFDAIGNQALVGGCSVQIMADAAWSLAVAEIKAPKLFKTMADAAPLLIETFDAGNLATTACAFARAKFATPRLFTTIANEARRQIDDFTPHELTAIAWAFATTGIGASQLFIAIDEAARSRLGDFDARELATTAWAFSASNVRAPRLFEAIAPITECRVNDLDARALADAAWAFACADWVDNNLFAKLASRAATKDLDDRSLAQFHAVSLHCQCEWPDLDLPLAKPALHAAYRRRVEANSQPSNLKGVVAAALKRRGWTHVLDHVMTEGLHLDIAQTESQRSVRVVTSNDCLVGTWIETGSTRLEARLVERLGWTTVRVPFYEWDELTCDLEQDIYLSAKGVTANPKLA